MPPGLEAATILTIATNFKLIWSVYIYHSSNPSAELTTARYRLQSPSSLHFSTFSQRDRNSKCHQTKLVEKTFFYKPTLTWLNLSCWTWDQLNSWKRKKHQTLVNNLQLSSRFDQLCQRALKLQQPQMEALIPAQFFSYKSKHNRLSGCHIRGVGATSRAFNPRNNYREKLDKSYFSVLISC